MTTSKIIQIKEGMRMEVRSYRDFILLEAEEDMGIFGTAELIWDASMTPAQAVQLATALLNAAENTNTQDTP